jgi:hypothetical protein
MAQCVYCDKTDTLNTQLTVTLEDGNRVTVEICDEHAEDATVKTARSAYLDKQDKIAQILAQAEALGLKLGPTTESGIATLEKQAPAKVPAPTPTQQESQLIEELGDEEDVVPTSRIDSKPGMVSIGGQTELGAVASHGSHEVSGKRDVLPQEVREGKAKMALVEGRGGQPIAIAEKRVDGTGTTRVKVLNKENDQKLQSRFKRMAADTMDERNPQVPDFARSGYKNTTISCPLCRGQGSVNQGTKVIECPKCDGAGFISTY